MYFGLFKLLLNFLLMIVMQITKRLGQSTPLIITVASGIIGRDALTNEFREVYISFLLLLGTFYR